MAADAERVPETAEEAAKALHNVVYFSREGRPWTRIGDIVIDWLARARAEERARVLGPVTEGEARRWDSDYSTEYHRSNGGYARNSAINMLLARRLGVETPPVGNEEVEGSG